MNIEKKILIDKQCNELMKSIKICYVQEKYDLAKELMYILNDLIVEYNELTKEDSFLEENN